MTQLGLVLLTCCAAIDAPRFEATVAAKAEPIAGELTSFGPNASATVGKEGIAAGELIELHLVGASRPMPPWDKPHILLANGDRWPGHVLTILDDRVKFAGDFCNKQEVTLPLSAIVAVWMTAPRLDAEPKPTDLDLPIHKRTVDEVYLTNGDVVRGTIAAMEKGDLTVETPTGLKKLPVERIAAVALSSDLTRVGKPNSATAKIVLTNGTRLTLADALLQDGRLVGKAAAGQSVRLLLADIAHLAMIGGKASYLSELTPAKYEHTPYFGVNWTLTCDRNSAGGWLRLGPDAFDRGIGMHSQSKVVYAVPAGATRFESWVGLDAVTGARGHVKVSAQINGRDQFGPVELAGGQLSRRVALTMPAEAKELTLHVDFGGGADVQDHVNWADARFVVPAMNRR